MGLDQNLLNITKTIQVVKNYLAFLLNLAERDNLKIPRSDSLHNPSLKLNELHRCDSVDLADSKAS